jgi:hypothetical protein
MPTIIISWFCVIGNALAMFNWKLESRIKALVVCVSHTMGIIPGDSIAIVHSLNSHLLWLNPRVYSRILILFYKSPWMVSMDPFFFLICENLPRKQGEKNEQPTKGQRGPLFGGGAFLSNRPIKEACVIKNTNIELNMNNIYPF